LGAGVVALLLSPGLPALAASRWRRGLGFEGVELGAYFLAAGAGRFGWPGGFWTGLSFIVAWRMIVAVDAFRAPAATKRLHWLLLVILSLGLLFTKEGVAFAMRANVVEAFRQPSDGMAPTLRFGDNFFARKHPTEIRRGDVVVFRYPTDPRLIFIQRVVGVGGDVVTMAGDQLTVNGTLVKRRAINEACPVIVEAGICEVWEESLGGRTYRVLEANYGQPNDDTWTVTVPPDSYFVLGDNRDNSSDSRRWGALPKDNLVGVPTFIWWSNDENGMCFDRMNRRVE